MNETARYRTAILAMLRSLAIINAAKKQINIVMHNLSAYDVKHKRCSNTEAFREAMIDLVHDDRIPLIIANCSRSAISRLDYGIKDPIAIYLNDTLDSLGDDAFRDILMKLNEIPELPRF
jgi:hypothetical protein